MVFSISESKRVADKILQTMERLQPDDLLRILRKYKEIMKE
jgi:hypothetical protein